MTWWQWLGIVLGPSFFVVLVGVVTNLRKPPPGPSHL